jgi:hypothetical protein
MQYNENVLSVKIKIPAQLIAIQGNNCAPKEPVLAK